MSRIQNCSWWLHSVWTYIYFHWFLIIICLQVREGHIDVQRTASDDVTSSACISYNDNHNCLGLLIFALASLYFSHFLYTSSTAIVSNHFPIDSANPRPTEHQPNRRGNKRQTTSQILNKDLNDEPEVRNTWKSSYSLIKKPLLANTSDSGLNILIQEDFK